MKISKASVVCLLGILTCFVQQSHAGDFFNSLSIAFREAKPVTKAQALGTWDCYQFSENSMGDDENDGGRTLALSIDRDGTLVDQEKREIGRHESGEVLLALTHVESREFFWVLRTKADGHLIVEYIINFNPGDRLRPAISVPGYFAFGYLSCRQHK